MAQLYSADYNSDTTGSLPSGWEINGVGFAPVVSTSNVFEGAKCVQLVKTGGAASQHWFALDVATDPGAGDYTVECTVWFDDNAGVRAGPAFRGKNAATNECYVAMLRANTSLRLSHLSGFTETVKTTATISSYSTDTHYHIKAYANGTALKVRYWADGGSEPGTWTIETTDSTLNNTNHYVGAYFFNGVDNADDVFFDALVVNSFSTDYTKTLTDSLISSSTVLKLPGKLLSSAINVSSVFAKAATLLKTLSENLNISSTLQKAASFSKSEGLDLESQLTQADVVGKFFTETVTMSTSLIKTVSRALQEVFSLASTAIFSQPAVNNVHAITIQHEYVIGSSNLTSFPVLLTECSFLSAAFENSIDGGDDLRFSTDIDGSNQIPFEIVKWDTVAEVAEIWVKVPTLYHDQDTVIYVHYNDPGASPLAANDTYGSDNVWNGYVGVYHMQQDYADSSPEANDGSAIGTPDLVSGKLGGGVDFSGTDEGVSVPHDASLNISGSYSLALWVNHDALGGGTYHTYLWKGNSGDTSAFRFSSLGDEVLVNVTGSVDHVTSAADLTTDSWNRVVASFDTTNNLVKIYVNGVEEYSAAETGSGGTNSNPLRLALQQAGFVNDFDGTMDEVHIVGAVRSGDWWTTEYNNQNDPCTFALPGSVYSRTLVEVIGVASSVFRVIGRTVSSTLTTTSQTFRAISRVMSNAFGISDSITKIYAVGLVLIDSVISASVSGLNIVLSRNLTESLVGISAITRAVYKTFSDSLVRSSVIALLGVVSKTLTLIYNIFAFVLGFRAKPTILSSKKDAPTLLSAKKGGPTVLGSEPFRPTVTSSKRQ